MNKAADYSERNIQYEFSADAHNKRASDWKFINSVHVAIPKPAQACI